MASGGETVGPTESSTGGAGEDNISPGALASGQEAGSESGPSAAGGVVDTTSNGATLLAGMLIMRQARPRGVALEPQVRSAQ